MDISNLLNTLEETSYQELYKSENFDYPKEWIDNKKVLIAL